MRYRIGMRVASGLAGLALGLVTLGVSATTASAVPQTELGVGPNLQSYLCPKEQVTKDWTMKFGGGTGTYSWTVKFGDGNGRTGTTSNNSKDITYTFTELGADGCRDFNQSWSASSGSGGTDYEETRVVWAR